MPRIDSCSLFFFTIFIIYFPLALASIESFIELYQTIESAQGQFEEENQRVNIIYLMLSSLFFFNLLNLSLGRISYRGELSYRQNDSPRKYFASLFCQFE